MTATPAPLAGHDGGPGLARRLDGAAKRLVDVVAAVGLLLICLPLIAVVACLIKLDSPGPVFYRCRRVGRRDEFDMLKFRKMRDDAVGPALTVRADRRFTRVGRFLARSKLDELPQLWNVVRGQMSMVGPRPEDARFVKTRAAEYQRILSVRPGVTGLCQLAFAKESDILDQADPEADYLKRIFPQKIAIDTLYATRRTLWMDARILLWTAVAVMLRRDVAVHRATGGTSLRRRPADVDVRSHLHATQAAPAEVGGANPANPATMTTMAALAGSLGTPVSENDS